MDGRHQRLKAHCHHIQAVAVLPAEAGGDIHVVPDDKVIPQIAVRRESPLRQEGKTPVFIGQRGVIEYGFGRFVLAAPYVLDLGELPALTKPGKKLIHLVAQRFPVPVLREQVRRRHAADLLPQQGDGIVRVHVLAEHRPGAGEGIDLIGLQRYDGIREAAEVHDLRVGQALLRQPVENRAHLHADAFSGELLERSIHALPRAGVRLAAPCQRTQGEEQHNAECQFFKQLFHLSPLQCDLVRAIISYVRQAFDNQFPCLLSPIQNLASMQSVSMCAAFKINGLILYPSYYQNWRVTEYTKNGGKPPVS